jgi:hypothetical protein
MAWAPFGFAPQDAELRSSAAKTPVADLLQQRIPHAANNYRLTVCSSRQLSYIDVPGKAPVAQLDRATDF